MEAAALVKSTCLGRTTRGVFGAVFTLAALIAVAAWIFDGADPLAPEPPPEPAPETTVLATESPSNLIRVALTRRAVQSIRLRVDGPFRIVPLDRDGNAETASESLPERRITVGPDGLTIAGRTFAGEGVELIPDESPGLWIDGRKYRGSVRLHVATDGRLRPVNVLPLEEYLAAVVDAEMPAAFPPAAREAQAIAARTYAVSCRRDPPHRWFDLYSTPISQNYLGVIYRDSDGRLLAGETPAGRAAASATAGLVCTHEGQLFRTYYSACCGGRTISGQAVFSDSTPPLCGVTCDGCGDAPLFRWSRTAPSDRLARLARTRSPSFGSVRSVETLRRMNAPGLVTVSDGRRTVRVTAAEVKSALDLPSLLFDLRGNADDLTAAGRGHGHGVGLCQWGAKGLAERGFTAKQIIEHYYPSCELTRLP